MDRCLLNPRVLFWTRRQRHPTTDIPPRAHPAQCPSFRICKPCNADCARNLSTMVCSPTALVRSWPSISHPRHRNATGDALVVSGLASPPPFFHRRGARESRAGLPGAPPPGPRGCRVRWFVETAGCLPCWFFKKKETPFGRAAQAVSITVM